MQLYCSIFTGRSHIISVCIWSYRDKRCYGDMFDPLMIMEILRVFVEALIIHIISIFFLLIQPDYIVIVDLRDF